MTNEEGLDMILEKLLELKAQLTVLNEKTGAYKRMYAMKDEINEIGWQGVVEKYHPDVNLEDPAAHPLFEMYRYVYNDMVKNMEIKQ